MIKKRARPQINPRTIRKHSQIVQGTKANLMVTGNREATKTGYVIKGTSCADFETYYEYIAAAQISDTVLHAKKSRTLRVANGQGALILTNSEGEVRHVSLIVGDEILLSPGISYAIASDAKSSLELFVTQAAKYSAKLEVIKESSSRVELYDEDLIPLSREDAMAQQAVLDMPRRRGSKAAAQQRAIAAERGREAPVSEGVPVLENINAKPSMGNEYGEPG